MDYLMIALGLMFAVSAAGIPIYAFFTKQTYVKFKSQFYLQGLFWLILIIINTLSLFNYLTTFSTVLNAIMVVLGLLFLSYATSMIIKDNGALLIPFAKMGNQPAFEAYIQSLDVDLVSLRTTNGKRYDVIDFLDTPTYQKEAIMTQIKENPDLVDAFGTKAARDQLMRVLLFPAFLVLLFTIL